MKKLLWILVAFGGMLMAGGNISPVAPVVTNPFYYGGALSYGGNIGDYTAFNSKSVGVTGILGYNINDCLATEGRIGYTYGGKLNFGGYLKPKVKVNNKVSVYALGGYTKQYGGNGGIAYGAGASYGNFQADVVKQTATGGIKTTVGYVVGF